MEQLISALPEPEAETSQDEYQRLAGYYDQLLNQRDEVYEQVEAIRPLLLKKFLVSLADSTQISRDEVLYQVRILEVPFQATLFNAFFLQIDNYYALPYSEQEKQELKAQMQAQISACASSIAYCAATELNDETLLIICNLHSEEPPEIGKQSFRALAEEIREELEGLWPITVTLGIGQICRCVEDLPLSCQRAKAALESVGLAERLHFYPNQLSGGQCQRVAIARAMVGGPELLLADEPTGALDTAAGYQIMEIFRSLADQGMTILMITHEPSIAACADKT